MDHRLTQAGIVDLLKKEYFMDVDRKTVKRNLMNLLDMGLDIEYTERKPVKELSGGEINLPKHVAEHIYMFAGDSIRAKFKAKNYIIDQLIDWFGKDVDIKPIDDEDCLVTVNVNKNAFLCWAVQYGQHINILEPADVRTQLIKNIKEILQKYE